MERMGEDGTSRLRGSDAWVVRMRRGNRDRVVQNRCVAVDRSGPWKMGLVDALAESLQEKAYCLAVSGVDKSQT
jgi:hypothetical protein